MAGQTIKCAANLRAIGQGIAIYVAENKGTYPAAYMYVGQDINAADQEPNAGYIHWSSYLYKKGGGQSTDGIFRSQTGWEAFQCPALEKGGLPPTNTFDANHDDGQQNQVPGVVDQQAPRMSYTVNEAIMPRNKFTKGTTVDNAAVNSTEHFVRAGSVRHSAETILATEFNSNWHVVSATTGAEGEQPVSKSHRPVHGFKQVGGATLDLPTINVNFGRGGVAVLQRCTVDDLGKDPEAGNVTINTRLDWVGRNHDKKVLVNGFDIRRTNFLYCDGHVQAKNIKETLAPKFEWGDLCYSYEYGSQILEN
jgi:prepilin-type processing-associated H-X9-DG protein